MELQGYILYLRRRAVNDIETADKIRAAFIDQLNTEHHNLYALEWSADLFEHEARRKVATEILDLLDKVQADDSEIDGVAYNEILRRRAQRAMSEACHLGGGGQIQSFTRKALGAAWSRVIDAPSQDMFLRSPEDGIL